MAVGWIPSPAAVAVSQTRCSARPQSSIDVAGGATRIATAELSTIPRRAARSASFLTAYAQIGLSPDAGLSWSLPRVVGPRIAAELLLTNRRIGADEARMLGIVSSLLDDDALEPFVEELARRLRTRSLDAWAAVRRLVSASPSATYGEQLEMEAREIGPLAAAPASGDAMRAFLRR